MIDGSFRDFYVMNERNDLLRHNSMTKVDAEDDSSNEKFAYTIDDIRENLTSSK